MQNILKKAVDKLFNKWNDDEVTLGSEDLAEKLSNREVDDWLVEYMRKENEDKN